MTEREELERTRLHFEDNLADVVRIADLTHQLERARDLLRKMAERLEALEAETEGPWLANNLPALLRYLRAANGAARPDGGDVSELVGMRAIAEGLLGAWAPACERIEIAGSVRRGKLEPHDIEIVAIPKTEVAVAERDMFADTDVTVAERNLLDELLASWKVDGRLRDRPDKNGRGAWGPRFKRARLEDGTAVDVFSVIPGVTSWGVIFAIRTGPADFSHALVASRLEGGCMPGGMQVKDGQLLRQGELVDTPEEDDLFRELGLPCWPPAERSVLRLAQWKRAQAS